MTKNYENKMPKEIKPRVEDLTKAKDILYQKLTELLIEQRYQQRLFIFNPDSETQLINGQMIKTGVFIENIKRSVKVIIGKIEVVNDYLEEYVK